MTPNKHVVIGSAAIPSRAKVIAKPTPKPVPPPAATPPVPAAPIRRVFPTGSKLHVGCGRHRLGGWVNADAVLGVGEVVLDLQSDVGLPVSTFSIVYGCHVLEHCWPQDTPGILRRLRDSLLPGGTLRLSVPDIRLVVKNCVDSQAYGGEHSALTVIYGGEFSRATAAPDLHRQTFWRERLERLLHEAGLVNVREWGRGQYPEIDALGDYATRPHGEDGKSLISLNLEADRPDGRTGRQAPISVEWPEPQGIFCTQSTSAPGVELVAETKQRATSSISTPVVDVSVLLGTVNRPEMLRECVESVRTSLRDSGCSYEVVVAYGAEDEPSLPWMRAQGDVVPVLGGMEGAIEAFNRAYIASCGRLVCQINDDVLVDGDAIARAVQHVDDDNSCAGVVFKFDREDGKGYRHEQVAGALHPNQMLVRRETCEAVVERIGAFWGDAAHRTDKTYGGDTAFGVVCRHLGLRLDSVEGVTCRDRLAQDALRTQNAASVASDHGARWRSMYEPFMVHVASVAAVDEWPRLYVPRIGMPARRSPIAAGRPLRLLHLSLQTRDEPQSAQRVAFSRIGPTIDLPWYPMSPEKEREILRIAQAHKPDVVFTQIQSVGWSPALVAELRKAVGSHCTLVNWTGDVRTNSGQPVERWMVELAQSFDVMLSDNTTYARKLVDEQVPAACGYLSCGVDLDANPFRESFAEHAGAVFLGTNYKTLDRGERERFFTQVAQALPGALRLHGVGWEQGVLASIARPFVGQTEAASIMRQAQVTISVSLFNDLGRYSSDRLKRALAAGAVVAVREFPDMAGLGLNHGENCLTWTSVERLVALIRDWTRFERAADRQKMREQAAALARSRFSWSRSMEELLAIVRDHRMRRGL